MERSTSSQIRNPNHLIIIFSHSISHSIIIFSHSISISHFPFSLGLSFPNRNPKPKSRGWFHLPKSETQIRNPNHSIIIFSYSISHSISSISYFSHSIIIFSHSISHSITRSLIFNLLQVKYLYFNINISSTYCKSNTCIRIKHK